MLEFCNIKHGAAAAVALIIMCMTSAAAAQDASFGVRLAGAYSSLPQPSDPEGEPTLMSGTAFTGFGYAFGAWAGVTVAELDQAQVAIDISGYYGQLRGLGYEQRGDARREASIKTRLVRVPILAVYENSAVGSTARIGAGVEPMIGIWSGAQVTVENTSENPEPLYTTPVTHLGLTGMVAYDAEVADGVNVPIELRLTYDPMVGKSTVDRFQNFESTSNPGDYEAAFRWQLMLATGISFDI